MKTHRIIPALIATATLVLSGCVSPLDVSRGFAFNAAPVAQDIAAQNWNVTGFEVNVPRTLVVSEANGIKPFADIVWREDPIGDRYIQVDDLMTAALERSFDTVTGQIPVFVSIEVTRFHAQTQRVRYSNLPSEHEIEFIVLVRHAETNEVLSGPSHVDLTFPAFGGEDALAADAVGVTQAMRITQRLRNWVGDEFIGPIFEPELLSELG